MNNWADEIPRLTLLLSFSVILSVLVKWGLQKLRLPAAVGWLGIGILLRLSDSHWHWLTAGAHEVFDFLGTLGVVCLLFRVGLQCHLKSLMAQFSRAIRIWCVDFLLSGLCGFAAAYLLLDLSLPTSLIIGVALTATSVGVSVAAWEERKCLDSPNGQLMLDVAELDDISGVVAMSFVFALLPAIHAGANGDLAPLMLKTLGLFLIKIVMFVSVCYLFSNYVEERLTSLIGRIHPPTDPLLLIVATGLLIASIAEFLGLSIAIGAFLAGVMFSRDPRQVRIEASFDPLYTFFTPFFFIGIGLILELAVVGPALMTGSILMVAAIVGKLAGKWLPGVGLEENPTRFLLGWSMIPRAEIAMIIVHRGMQLGDWAMPASVFGAMVFVSLTTCIISPLAVHSLLSRYPQSQSMND